MTPETGPNHTLVLRCLRSEVNWERADRERHMSMSRLDRAADRRSFDQRHDCFEWFMIFGRVCNPRTELTIYPARAASSRHCFGEALSQVRDLFEAEKDRAPARISYAAADDR